MSSVYQVLWHENISIPLFFDATILSLAVEGLSSRDPAVRAASRPQTPHVPSFSVPLQQRRQQILSDD